MVLINTKYVVTARFGVITLAQGEDSLWRDTEGTLWDLSDYTASVDPVDRCGVGFASLATSNPLTDDCSVHDHLYSSPVYQTFHTRIEADKYLESLISNNPTWWRIFARPFYLLARWFGAPLWEDKNTND